MASPLDRSARQIISQIIHQCALCSSCSIEGCNRATVAAVDLRNSAAFRRCRAHTHTNGAPNSVDMDGPRTFVRWGRPAAAVRQAVAWSPAVDTRTAAASATDSHTCFACRLLLAAPLARAQWGNYTGYNMTDNSTVVAATPQPVIQYVPVPVPVPQPVYVQAPAPPPQAQFVAAQPQQPQAFMATIPTQTVVAAVPVPTPVPVPVPGPPVTVQVPVSAAGQAGRAWQMTTCTMLIQPRVGQRATLSWACCCSHPVCIPCALP